MSSLVAPVSVTSEVAHSASVASANTRSNGSIMPGTRVCTRASAGASSSSWIGVLTAGGGVISQRPRLAGDVLDRLPVPLREDRAGHGRRGVGAEAAVLDGHGDDD